MKYIALVLLWIFFTVLSYKPVLVQASLPEVVEMLGSVDPIRMGDTMQSFSSFKTRFHKHPEAIKAQEWLKSKWEEVAQDRNDVSVDFFYHPEEVTPMPSIILTIPGSSAPEEIIVLGAHADSIVTDFDVSIELMVRVLGINPRSPNKPPVRVIRDMYIERMNLRSTAESPGADDNASGIAVITEILRVLIEHEYLFKRTIMFMAYSAEEIGLKGSDHIAESFAREGRNVIGVLNFDMTNYRGSPDRDLVLASDYIHPRQNIFLEYLLQTYLPGIRWGYDECGRCSDHFSWHKFGFRASKLTEARSDEINPNWHKATDTFEESGGTAEHSVTFAKLGLAFTVEIDRFGLCRYDQEECSG